MERGENESDTWRGLSLSADGVRWSLEEEERDFKVMVCPARGLPTAEAVMSFQIRIVMSADPEMMCRPSGE